MGLFAKNSIPPVGPLLAILLVRIQPEEVRAEGKNGDAQKEDRLGLEVHENEPELIARKKGDLHRTSRVLSAEDRFVKYDLASVALEPKWHMQQLSQRLSESEPIFRSYKEKQEPTSAGSQ